MNKQKMKYDSINDKYRSVMQNNNGGNVNDMDEKS